MQELKLLDFEYETIDGQYRAPNVLKYMNTQLGIAVSEQELDVVYQAFEIYNYILAYYKNTFVVLDGNMYEKNITKIVNKVNTFAEVFDDAWSLVELRFDEVYDAYQNGCISKYSYNEYTEALEKLHNSFEKIADPQRAAELENFYKTWLAV